jgi:hypothetical protein
LRAKTIGGYERIEGELLKLGHTISHETVGTILQRHAIPPVPERDTSPNWRHLMTHYKDQLLACDFFTVETLFLQTHYMLILSERHLRHFVTDYVTYFNQARPHQGINQRIPCTPQLPDHPDGKIVGMPVLGGLHHDYERKAA